MAKSSAPTTIDNNTGAVAVQGISRTDIASVQSFEAAFELALAHFGEIVSSTELGDGFTVVDKKDIVGKAMLILGWEPGKNEKFGPFTIVRAITRTNEKILFVDGSSGIKEQLQVFENLTGRAGGILAETGLRVSNYTYTDDKGEERPASTYYIDVAAAGTAA